MASLAYKNTQLQPHGPRRRGASGAESEPRARYAASTRRRSGEPAQASASGKCRSTLTAAEGHASAAINPARVPNAAASFSSKQRLTARSCASFGAGSLGGSAAYQQTKFAWWSTSSWSSGGAAEDAQKVGQAPDRIDASLARR